MSGFEESLESWMTSYILDVCCYASFSEWSSNRYTGLHYNTVLFNPIQVRGEGTKFHILKLWQMSWHVGKIRLKLSPVVRSNELCGCTNQLTKVKLTGNLNLYLKL